MGLFLHFPGVIAISKISAALLLTSVGIKLLDDTLDAPRDQVAGRPNCYHMLGAASPLYAIWLLLLAVALESSWTFAFFGSAYALGMLRENNQSTLPDFIPYQARSMVRWFEIIFAILVGLSLSDLIHVIVAFLTLLAIQQVDDLVDGDWHDIPMEFWWLRLLFLGLSSWGLYPGVIAVAFAVSMPVIWSTRARPAKGVPSRCR